MIINYVTMILITLLCVAGVALIANIFLSEKKFKISFKESLDLAELPVITFKEGNKKLNFLIDTGSTYSHITKKVSKELEGEPLGHIDHDCCGVSSYKDTALVIESYLKYDKKSFKVNLIVNSALDSSFAEIKKVYGVTIHGILGNDFLNEYRYIINYNTKQIYSK